MSMDIEYPSNALTINLHGEAVFENGFPAQLHKHSYARPATLSPEDPHTYLARHVLENLAICDVKPKGLKLLNRGCERGWAGVKLV